MLFNSLHFICFFPIVTLIYFAIPHKMRYLWLLFTSYYFYMSWNPIYAILMATSTLITFLSGILIDKANKDENEIRKKRFRKLWLWLSLGSNFAILFYYKYFNFALDNINLLLTSFGFKILSFPYDILLPVGISFYTFQALSYTMDVFRGEIEAESNFLKYALFVSFFPQLVAGPIERSKNLLTQVSENHYFDYNQVKSGLLLMLWGYFQKLVVADRVAVIVNIVYNNYQSYNGTQLIFATIMFAFQIYCDFSGYSFIAIGAARILGFSLMDNFHQPYFANSVQNFWRRWHISLSTWFRDYLYIPLGGSRCSQLTKYRNVMITFLVSGLWHGANWTFVVWGGLHGIFQVFGEIMKPYKEKLLNLCRLRADSIFLRVWSVLSTFILVDFAWIFFRAADINQAFSIIGRMISDFRINDLLSIATYRIGLNDFNIAVSMVAIFILLIVDFIQTKNYFLDWISRKNIVVRWAFYYAASFIVIIFGVLDYGYDINQFIYFQF